MFAAIDNWIFFVLAAIAVLFRFLASKTSTSSTDDVTPNEPSQKRDQSIHKTRSSDEERIRKFLEALGQPSTVKPPPAIAPRTDVAPRPVAPVRPPRSMIPVPERRTAKTPPEQRPEIAERPQAEAAPPPLPRRRYQPRQSAPRQKESPVFEVHDTSSSTRGIEPTVRADPEAQGRPAETAEQPAISFVRLLRTPGGLREAMILREIFGPPRSLQSVDDLAGIA
jgi:hypothetical protein